MNRIHTDEIVKCLDRTCRHTGPSDPLEVPEVDHGYGMTLHYTTLVDRCEACHGENVRPIDDDKDLFE